MEDKTNLNDHSGGNNGQLPTHAYVHWAATKLLAVFAPAFPLSLLRQEIRPQTAQAHSLGRYVQQQKKKKKQIIWTI